MTDNQLEVTPLSAQGSHILNSMVRANCFIVIPAENNTIAKSEIVTVLPFGLEI
jgi:molybdopterin molybdotransferase